MIFEIADIFILAYFLPGIVTQPLHLTNVFIPFRNASVPAIGSCMH
jgi:hypothetical protein